MTPNEVFAPELRRFVSENVTEAGVRSYLESAFSSRNHSFRSVCPNEISHCQFIAIVGALKVIYCEDHTREVTEDNLEYYFAAVSPAGTGKTTAIRQLIYCLLSYDDIRDSFHQLARSFA